nr:MAG TPA: hypothetical protein [Caudoviricetes sp.]
MPGNIFRADRSTPTALPKPRFWNGITGRSSERFSRIFWGDD